MIELTTPVDGEACWFCAKHATVRVTFRSGGQQAGFGACDHIRHRHPAPFIRWMDSNFLPTGEGRKDVCEPINGITRASLFLRATG